MKRKSIVIITALMALALMGVIAMQYYFLRQSYRLQSDLFDSNVKAALNNVVARVSKQDAVNFLSEKARYQNHRATVVTDSAFRKSKPAFSAGKIENVTDANMTDDGLIHLPTSKTNPTHNLHIAKLRDSVTHMLVQNRLEQEMEDVSRSLSIQSRVEENEYGQLEQYVTIVPQNNYKVIANQTRLLQKAKQVKYLDTLRYTYIDPQFGRQVVSVPRLNPLWVQEQQRIKRDKQLKQIQKLLQVERAGETSRAHKGPQAVFENLYQEYSRKDEPLDKRINPIWIDTLLRYELNSRGITQPFSYEVTQAHNDSVIYSKAMDVDGQKPFFIAANTYHTPIFSQEVINDPGDLKIYFPQKNSLILSKMGSSMATTGGLLLFFIFCFGFTIYAILRQKKISEMKTDFINNMTHEFKTPVSTIMIASEALKDAEIARDKDRVAKLAGIIYEENVRLGSHIERVLNIARIEKNDFKLDIKRIEINEIIAAVIDSMALKLQKHEVKLDLRLTEDEVFIKADELHFSNVIYNLVDNAIKYSHDTPELTIVTYVKGNQAIIRVADKGIGMNNDQQKKIFEQFYRIPTGNLHDVKGFGLGLSYVNTIVKRLNGTISVRSEKDKGSEFELKFDKVDPRKTI
jgi:two-component system phosphate regulon sensor histidine kinase PhoR